MTIIVAFILEAFVFRMNYSRKNKDSEGLQWAREGRGHCSSSFCLSTQLSAQFSSHLSVLALCQFAFLFGLFLDLYLS